jgi:hypothetical protein
MNFVIGAVLGVVVIVVALYMIGAVRYMRGHKRSSERRTGSGQNSITGVWRYFDRDTPDPRRRDRP